MSYVPTPATGALFRNERKSKDHHPDYKGTLCLPDGATVQVAGWVVQGERGKYLSLKLNSVLPPVSAPD